MFKQVKKHLEKSLTKPTLSFIVAGEKKIRSFPISSSKAGLEKGGIFYLSIEDEAKRLKTFLEIIEKSRKNNIIIAVSYWSAISKLYKPEKDIILGDINLFDWKNLRLDKNSIIFISYRDYRHDLNNSRYETSHLELDLPEVYSILFQKIKENLKNNLDCQLILAIEQCGLIDPNDWRLILDLFDLASINSKISILLNRPHVRGFDYYLPCDF